MEKRSKPNWISYIFFLYMIPLFWNSFKKDFTEDDVSVNHKEANRYGDLLEKTWMEKRKTSKKWSLLSSMFKVFGLEFCIIGILCLIRELTTIILLPMLVERLILHFADPINEEDGYILFAIWAFVFFIIKILLHAVMFRFQTLTMKIRSSCTSLIYRKSLRLDQKHFGKSTAGKVVNLLSNDMQKFDTYSMLVHMVWITPIQLIVGTYLLYTYMGWIAFIGVIFLFIFFPIILYLSKKISMCRLKMATKTDTRVKLMNEICSNIKTIKMYTWEKAFLDWITIIRREEMSYVLRSDNFIGLLSSFDGFVVRGSIFVTLVACVFFELNLKISDVFAVVCIHYIMRFTAISQLTCAIPAVIDIKLGLDRVQEFLNTPEKTVKEIEVDHDDGVFITNVIKSKKCKVVFGKVSAKWQDENTLTDISFSLDGNQMIGVIGPVGSGKSSLLNVILQELPVTSGHLSVTGSISYAPQEPFLFNGSIRQNVLFGGEFNAERYKKVCQVCALERDFTLLPSGDDTSVDLLSGGQKSRVNLARCIYREADIYLLDDPLSAVDNKVGGHIFKECIQGFLEGKIRILITHQLQHLRKFEDLIILENGKVSCRGSYSDLQASDSDFAKSLKIDDQKESTEMVEQTDEEETVNSSSNENKEEMNSGSIKLKTYWTYFRSGGNAFILILLLTMFIISQLIYSYLDYFVMDWMSHDDDVLNNKDFQLQMVYTYSAVILATIPITLIRSIWHYRFCSKGAERLHFTAFTRLLETPMKFFDSNPTGRILNTFSKDFTIVDIVIPHIVHDVFSIQLNLIAILIMGIIIKVYLIIPSLILIIISIILLKFYMRLSLMVKRIYASSRSPIFGHLRSSLNGLSTIRAFNAENKFSEVFDDLQDFNNSSWVLCAAAVRAFGFWNDLSCIVVLSTNIVILVYLDENNRSEAIGFLLTLYMSVMLGFQWGMRQTTEMINEMVSVERIQKFTNLKREDDFELNFDWPKSGNIEFNDTSLEYSEGKKVLDNLNLVVKSGEKIGIIGRTGAGKSTILSALYQLYKTDGKIVIDNCNISDLPIKMLRRNISIIPQEPVLFETSVRKNLDPFDEYTDRDIWQTLSDVELKDSVSDLSEMPRNFSLGQRQLFCLARALLRNNKILVLDEATANVDPQTESLIQKTLKLKFSDCTVLTIAHRLQTVMESDKILVMESGRAAEFAHPYELLSMETGIFKSMLQSSGDYAHLSNIAEKNYQMKKME